MRCCPGLVGFVRQITGGLCNTLHNILFCCVVLQQHSVAIAPYTADTMQHQHGDVAVHACHVLQGLQGQSGRTA